VNDLGEELEITIKSGKGRKDRVLFLNNGGGDAVKDYLSARGDSPGFLFWSSLKGGKMVPESKMTDQAVYARIKRCATNAGVKSLSPHDMRRSFVSDMLDNGVDISTVAAMAGHSSMSTTQRYDRRGDEAKK
jgi:site-specific recombinase XerD